MNTVRYAAASELLHNATLLHDDVVDGSALRRGAPTVASILNSSASVLIGDFWLVKAMEDILSSDSEDFSIVRLFSRTLSHLSEGEMLQLQKSSSGDTSEQDYFRIIYSKTASLFEAACVSAAKSVNASEEAVKAAGEYAVAVGLAFQIKDDLLDYSDANIGKPTGQDLLEQKITLPLLCALEHADAAKQAEIRSLVCSAMDHHENIPVILAFVEEHNGVVLAKERLLEYCGKAVEALSVLPDSPAKSYLVDIADYIAERNI